MRQPVTLGSRVPLCPVFSILFLSAKLYRDLLMYVIPKHALHPSNDFMTGGIGRFVKVDYPRTDIGV